MIADGVSWVADSLVMLKQLQQWDRHMLMRSASSTRPNSSRALHVTWCLSHRSRQSTNHRTLTTSGLQEEYAQLQQKYAELKERKIQDLDSMLEEGTAKLAAHNETAVKLAEHWRQEAHRQAAFAQAAGAPAMQVPAPCRACIQCS